MPDDDQSFLEKIYPKIYILSIGLSAVSGLIFLYLYLRKKD